MPAHDLPLLTDAIRMAGRVARSFTGKTARRWDKPGDAGPVTEADLAVDNILSSTLRTARPEYGWLSEETEDTTDRLSADTVFVVDPIDGTRSFVEGSQTWAISVAVAHQGRVTAAAIYLPMRDLLYTAADGAGAFLNGKPVTVSAHDGLQKARMLAAKPVMQPSLWASKLPQFDRHYRPSLAYRLSLVAEGRFDGMLTLRPTWEWDIAAGALIVSEAGGAITDRNGAPLVFNNAKPLLNGVVAAAPAVHAETVPALKPVTPA